MDGAESERELAYAINVKGTANLAALCQEVGAKLVHFSTDHVFDGKSKMPRVESDGAASFQLLRRDETSQ